MIDFLKAVNNLLWGVPVLALILCVGIGLSIATGMWQIRKLPVALKYFLSILRKDSNNGRSGYRALCNALAATVGTGNLGGVAGAITIGGPGAVFWMWVSGIIGMMIKFAEIALAMQYRQRGSNGYYIGGPMYIIQNALPVKFHFLACLYCFFGTVAVFGIGNTTQISAIIDAVDSAIPGAGSHSNLMLHLMIGLLIAVFVHRVFSNDMNVIGRITEVIIPISACLYVLLSLGLLIVNYSQIPNALLMIIKGAFSPRAVTGGIVGSFFVTMRIGTSRGVFTNEAGMGTASIAHSESNVDNPIHQGYMGIVEVFLDTIVICSLTALVILCSGISIPYGTDQGATLTLQAFSCVYGNWINYLMSAIITMLAFATILGWGLYGQRCAQYLFGDNIRSKFALLQAMAVILGAVMNTSTVWLVSELVNALMAIPNLIALFYLSPQIIEIVKTHR